jgi:galactose mutarotase-like enzyme
MFTVRVCEGAIPTVEFADTAAGSHAVLAPSRGGMLTELTVGGRELMYLDRATFEDRAANVRGGNPVLFPSPGKLTGDAWAWGGARGAMKQHGFARNLPWTVEEHGSGTPGGAYVKLGLRSTDVSRAQYPWDFRAEYTYTLAGVSLRIDLRVTNEGDRPMPFGAGFHPYFAVPDADKAKTTIETRATRAFDNTQKRDVTLAGIDLTLPEVDLHLADHGSTESALAIGGETRVRIRGSREFTHWVIWTRKGRDFVCLEPWTSAGDALNTGKQLMLVPAGETRALWLEFIG